MIVDFTPAARDDLASIGEWIARDDPARAASFVDELIDQAESLIDRMNQFPEVDPRRRPGLRRLNYRRYRIFYVVDVDAIRILHVHHGARAMPDA